MPDFPIGCNSSSVFSAMSLSIKSQIRRPATDGVRRANAAIPSGWEIHPSSAPAGSKRNGWSLWC